MQSNTEPSWQLRQQLWIFKCWNLGFSVDISNFRPGAPAAVNGIEALNVGISRFGPGAPAAGSGLELRNIKVLVSEAARAGNGFEDLKVEVSSFRPGAPAAGSSLENF